MLYDALEPFREALGVSLEPAGLVAATKVAVVDVDVFVAAFVEAKFNEEIGLNLFDF